MRWRHQWPDLMRCLQRACGVLVPSALVLFTAPVLADTINGGSYNAWQWNGFSQTQASPMPSPVPESPSPGGTASLSGFVYLDASPDTNKMTNADWAILGADSAHAQQRPAAYRLQQAGRLL